MLICGLVFELFGFVSEALLWFTRFIDGVQSHFYCIFYSKLKEETETNDLCASDTAAVLVLQLSSL